MPYKNKLLIIAFLIITTIASFFIYWIKSKQNTYTDEIITEASGAFKKSLRSFLESATITIKQINKNINDTDNKGFDSNNLTVSLSKMILGDRYLQGVILYHDKFSYIIYRDNSTWAISYDLNLNDTLLDWKRLNNKLELVSEWTDAYNFLPDDKKLSNINEQLHKQKFIWQTSISQMNDKGDLLTNVFKTTNGNNDEMIVGLVFNTKELSNNFVSVLKFERPFVSIITTNNDIVTPLVTDDSVTVSRFTKLRPQIVDFANKWNANNPKTAQSFSFNKFNEVYWTRVDSISKNVGIKGFAITISANDLAEAEKKQESIYLLIAGIFFVITIVLSYILFRKKKVNGGIKSNDIKPLDDADVKKLIRDGETEYVEFKSSLRWDYREKKINKILEYVILKSIAAFANAKGGTLFIGVSDELEILGLQPDFNTLKKQDADYFELHARKLINNEYGIAFSNENLLMSFNIIDDKTICVIQISPSETPVFIKSKSKLGGMVEKFYVRSGNASQEISSLKEVNEYIKVRFH